MPLPMRHTSKPEPCKNKLLIASVLYMQTERPCWYANKAENNSVLWGYAPGEINMLPLEKLCPSLSTSVLLGTLVASMINIVLPNLKDPLKIFLDTVNI